MDQTRSELAMRLPLKSYKFKPFSDWPAFIGRAGVADFANRRASIDFQKSEFGGPFVDRCGLQTSEYSSLINIRGDLSGSLDSSADS